MPQNIDPAIAASRARLAGLHTRKDTAPDPALVAAARADLDAANRAAAAERHIAALVEAWPPLTAEQKEKLASLIAPTAETVAAQQVQPVTVRRSRRKS